MMIESLTNIPIATILIVEVVTALVASLVFVKSTARPELLEQYANGEDHGRS